MPIYEIKEKEVTLPITLQYDASGLLPARDALTSRSLVRQFIGRYRYDGFTGRDGKSLNNMSSDSKSRPSLFYHLYPSALNRIRSQQRIMGNTYQFYIWQTINK